METRPPGPDEVVGVRLPTHPTPCGYFADRAASFEHYLLFDVDGPRVDTLVERGFRHFGNYYFRPGAACCGECIPLRVPAKGFRPSRSQRRVWRRARAAGVVVVDGRPEFTEEKFALYAEHKRRFPGPPPESADDFRQSFYGAGPPVREFVYTRGGQLLGVGLVTLGAREASSMYFFYGAEGATLSLGTFSVLHEIGFCVRERLDHLYLGYYVGGNRFMRYKASFQPFELRVGGAWVRSDSAEALAVLAGGAPTV